MFGNVAQHSFVFDILYEIVLKVKHIMLTYLFPNSYFRSSENFSANFVTTKCEKDLFVFLTTIPEDSSRCSCNYIIRREIYFIGITSFLILERSPTW